MQASDKKNLIRVLPVLSILGMYIIKYILFYMGMVYEDNFWEKVIAHTFGLIISLMSMVVIIREHKEMKKFLVLLLIVGGIFCCAWGKAFFLYGLSTDFLKRIIIWGVYCPSALCMGYYAFKKKIELLSSIELMGQILYPALLGYAIMAVTNSNPFEGGRNLGYMSYFMVGYVGMPVMAAETILVLKNAPAVGCLKRVPHRYLLLIRIILIAILWIDIMASGTRGAILGIVVFWIFCILYSLFKRRKKGILIILSSIFIASYLICLSLPGFRGLDRMDIFIEGLSRGELVTSESGVRADEYVTYEKNKEELSFIDSSVLSGTQTDIGEFLAEEASDRIIGDRGELFRVAIKEIRMFPWEGIGLEGYMLKYGNYTHNIILDIWCEYGWVCGTALIAILLIMGIKFLRGSLKGGMIESMFLFFCTFWISFVASGYLWENKFFFFFVGYMFGVCTVKLKREDGDELCAE